MNEQELRDGLRDMMGASSPPPSMNPNSALDTAKRAHKRRRATLTGAGAGLAVVALAVGTVFALSPGENNLPVEVAGPPKPTNGVVTTGMLPPNAPTATGQPEDTETEWPDGQKDRTATSGPQAAKGQALLESLKAVLPDTLSVNTAITYPDSDRPVTASQSQFVDYYGVDKKQIWEHAATIAVNRKTAPQGGTGRVFVQMTTPGTVQTTDVCEIAKQFWGIGGTCTVRDVQGKKVGVVDKAEDPRIGQAVGYRYEDGTIVVVAQSKDPNNNTDGTKPIDGAMAELPMTLEQLTPLVLSPAFKIG